MSRRRHIDNGKGNLATGLAALTMALRAAWTSVAFSLNNRNVTRHPISFMILMQLDDRPWSSTSAGKGGGAC
jgi:hypothetical protein